METKEMVVKQEQVTVSTLLKDYNEQEQNKIRELANHIPIGNNEAVMVYGTQAQSKLSGFTDSMLSKVRQKEMGEIGEILSDLMVQLGDVNVKDFGNDKPSFLDKIRRKANRKKTELMAKYQSVSTQVDSIVQNLETSKVGLMNDIVVMDSMYEQNKEYLKGVNLYIVAGELRMEEIKTQLLPKLQEKAISSDDPVAHQELQDMNQFLERLDKRIYDLKLTKQIIIQSAPQIRMIQATSQTLAEKIQSSILTSIPLWKNQITIALTLKTQSQAVQAQKLVTDTTNELLLRNSEMLKMNTIATAKESERGVVEVETLKKVQENLIKTIEETMRIQAEGRQQRKLAEAEIIKMEQELKERMIKIHTENDFERRSYANDRTTVEQPLSYLEM